MRERAPLLVGEDRAAGLSRGGLRPLKAVERERLAAGAYGSGRAVRGRAGRSWVAGWELGQARCAGAGAVL